jgi:hypothetical protein
MDDPPYPEILNNQNFVMVKASPPDADHPDDRIWPGAKIFKLGENTNYDTWPYDPSSEPTHHFDYDSDYNWIYIAFQTELSDYAFAGALVYEYCDDGTSYRYTGQTAKPVYDPAIVTPLANHFREAYSVPDHPSSFNPSRPIRVVRYNLSKRAGTGSLMVRLRIIPLDSLDRPNDGDDSVQDGSLKEKILFIDGADSEFETNLGLERMFSEITVWYTD